MEDLRKNGFLEYADLHAKLPPSLVLNFAAGGQSEPLLSTKVISKGTDLKPEVVTVLPIPLPGGMETALHLEGRFNPERIKTALYANFNSFPLGLVASCSSLKRYTVSGLFRYRRPDFSMLARARTKFNLDTSSSTTSSAKLVVLAQYKDHSVSSCLAVDKQRNGAFVFKPFLATNWAIQFHSVVSYMKGFGERIGIGGIMRWEKSRLSADFSLSPLESKDRHPKLKVMASQLCGKHQLRIQASSTRYMTFWAVYKLASAAHAHLGVKISQSKAPRLSFGLEYDST